MIEREKGECKQEAHENTVPISRRRVNARKFDDWDYNFNIYVELMLWSEEVWEFYEARVRSWAK